VGDIEQTRGGIEPTGGRVEPAGGRVEATGAGAVRPSARASTRFAGRDVSYVDEVYSPSQSWDLLSDGIRDWAQARAGHQIVDPHTRRGTVYWYCNVVPGEAGRGRDRPADYDLVMFGKRGLAVSSGTTGRLVGARAATRWRHRRFDVPVDASGIRHDHRSAPAPVPPPPGTPPGGRAGPEAPVLPAEAAQRLGNLPVETQQFLVAPFADRRRAPAEVAVHARLSHDRHELAETYWVFMFDKRWVAFAQARRHGPASGDRRSALPLLAASLAGAPWMISAWVAPVAAPGHAVVPG
jgi:hypothetical protein